MSTGRKCPLFCGHFDLVDIYVSIHVHKNALFDPPGRQQDTPEIAYFPTLDAYFGRVDH
jgi:hypothetical protein